MQAGEVRFGDNIDAQTRMWARRSGRGEAAYGSCWCAYLLMSELQ